MKSADRTFARAVSAKTCSTRSPIAWPKRSLIDLKWSRSSSSTAEGRGLAAWRLASSLPSFRNERRLAMPVSGSTMAAVRWRNSVRSLAIASRMNAIAMVNSSASKLSTVSHTLSNTWFMGDHGSIAASGVRNRNSDPCANSMKIAGQRETRGSQRPQLESAADAGKMGDDHPTHGAGEEIQRQHAPPVEHARAGPGDREAEEQDHVGEIDRDRPAHRPVHAEQHDRARPQQMRATPPGDRADLGILHPREQKQQSQDRFDVDRDEEKRVDVEVHRAESRGDIPTAA